MHTSIKPAGQKRDRKADENVKSLSITYCAVGSIKVNAENCRVHSKKQIRQIGRSIEAFGFNVPLLIDEQFRLIAGHGRLEAAKMLGIENVPTISLEHLSDLQIAAFAIADNRLTENSEWDSRLLAEQLKALSAKDLDFSLDTTGFEMGEIDLLIDGLDPTDEDSRDTVHELQDDTIQVSRNGELWLLGSSRIYCGSALEDQSFTRLLQGRRANLVFIDPPYNVKIAGFAGNHGAIQHPEFEMAKGDLTSAQFTDFLTRSMEVLVTNSVDGSIHYICTDWRHVPEVVEAAKLRYEETKNICVWVKDQPGLGSLYRSQHEMIFVCKNGKASHHNNVRLGSFGRNRSNIWHYPAINSFAKSGLETNLLALHPTAKPVALVADAIMDCSRRGDIVLDSFLGSGTTVIAAESTGRRGYGIELNPSYVDTAIRRWQSFTGLSAVHGTSGRKFDEVERELIDAQ